MDTEDEILMVYFYFCGRSDVLVDMNTKIQGLDIECSNVQCCDLSGRERHGTGGEPRGVISSFNTSYLSISRVEQDGFWPSIDGNGAGINNQRSIGDY